MQPRILRLLVNFMVIAVMASSLKAQQRLESRPHRELHEHLSEAFRVRDGLTMAEQDRVARVIGWKRLQDLRIGQFAFEQRMRFPSRPEAAEPLATKELEDLVFDCYEEFYSERLQEAFSIDIRIDQLRSRLSRQTAMSRDRTSARFTAVRFSPQIDLTDGGYVGLKVRLPQRRGTVFSHTSFLVRERLDSRGTEVAVRFENQGRYLTFEHETGSGEGARYFVGFRLEL